MGEATAAPAEREGRSDHDRCAEALDERHPVVDALDHGALRHRFADADDEIAKAAAILGGAHGVERGAEHADVVTIQHAGIVERHGEVETGLPAEGGQKRVRLVLLDHAGRVAAA